MSSKKSALQLNTRTVVVIGIGAVLYGLLSYATYMIPVAGNNLRIAIALLSLIGALFGPLVGFFVGTFGTLLNDFLGGGFWPHWAIGNGIIGLIAGLAYYLKGFDLEQGLVKGSHYIGIALYGIIGNFVGLITAALVDVLMGQPLETIYLWAVIPAAVNSLWVVTLGLLLVFAVARRNAGKADLEVGQ